jgi:hypothetical protein
LSVVLQTDGDYLLLYGVSKVFEDFHIDGIPPPFSLVGKLERHVIRHSKLLPFFCVRYVRGPIGIRVTVREITSEEGIGEELDPGF